MTTTTCKTPDQGSPGPEDSDSSCRSNGRQGPRVVVLVTASVLVAAGLVLFLYLRSRPDHPLPKGSTAAPAALELDLGGGPPGERISIPVLSPPAGLQDVTLAFMVPVNPGALYEVEVQGPGDEPLLSSERGPLLLDDLGGARFSVPSSRFEKSGTYRLVLREFASDGAVREYRYPFRVCLPAAR
jgi:hypothetical protein